MKYAQFRPILSHFPLSTGQIFNPISPHENIINFFQLKYISILHIKRQQKITQAKVFENFTSRQRALVFMGGRPNQGYIQPILLVIGIEILYRPQSELNFQKKKKKKVANYKISYKVNF